MITVKKIVLIVYLFSNVVTAKNIDSNYTYKSNLRLKFYSFFIRSDIEALSEIDLEPLAFDVEFSKNITMITNW